MGGGKGGRQHKVGEGRVFSPSFQPPVCLVAGTALLPTARSLAPSPPLPPRGVRVWEPAVAADLGGGQPGGVQGWVERGGVEWVRVG